MRAAGLNAFRVWGAILLLGLGVQTGWAKPAGRWDQFRFWDRPQKEKPVAPVEELYDQAMRYYQGRETWFRRSLPFRRDSAGELRSWAVRHNYPKAIKLFQDVVTHYPYSKYTPLSELHVADCQFAMEDYEEAGAGYESFIKFHPVHAEVAYATYRLGLCHYHRRLKHYRDQTETKAAATQFQIVLARYPASPYAAEIEPLLLDCRERLARHELDVGDFYFRHGKYWASAMRYAAIGESYADMAFADQALFQEAQSYDRLQRFPEATERYQRLLDRYPESGFAPNSRSRLDGLQVSP